MKLVYITFVSGSILSKMMWKIVVLDVYVVNCLANNCMVIRIATFLL